MIDLTAVVSFVVGMAHNAKVYLLAMLAFYIVGDALATMIKEQRYLDWRYATNYIRKFADVYLGLVVMAVMGQYVQAIDALFYVSIAVYSKSEIEGLLKKFGSVTASQAPAA